MINSTTIQKYYRAISVLFNFLKREEILEVNPLDRIKVPRAEKKVVKALSTTEVNQLIMGLGKSFEGIRNKAMILVLVDCGLRLGELLHLKMADMNVEEQLLKVDDKTGERVVRFGSTTVKALLNYTKDRQVIDGHVDKLWITQKGVELKAYSVETLLSHLSRKTGIPVMGMQVSENNCICLDIEKVGISI
jgi:integrase/recombinase XerC